jgi:hypothetical protein
LNSIVALMVSLMVSMGVQLAPGETKQLQEDRYNRIAQDVVSVVYDPQVAPLYSGPYGRIKTALLVIAIMNYESDYRQEVDDGTVRGDNGKSWCLGQVKLGKPHKDNTKLHAYVDSKGYFGLTDNPRIGWRGQDLVQDRTKCIRIMVAASRTSFFVMRRRGYKHPNWLNIYTSGKYNKGGDASSLRVNLAVRWWRQIPTEETDASVLAKLTQHKFLQEAVFFQPRGAQNRTMAL